MRLVKREPDTLAAAMYVLSFVLPTFSIVEGLGGTTSYYLGGEAFFICMINGYNLNGITPFCLWLANPLFWAALIAWCGGRKELSAIASGGALLIGVWAVFQPHILVGYYLRLGSFLLPFVGGLADLGGDKQEIHVEPHHTAQPPR